MVLHLRIALNCGAAAVLGCIGSVYAATSSPPDTRRNLVVTVRQMMESLTSPVSFKMNKDEADRYWDKKKECVRSVERSTDEEYPWCDDPDYAILQSRPISEMSDVQYDLYRSLHDRCADALGDEPGRRIDECADPRLREFAGRPLRDLSTREYHCYWWLSEKCRDQKEERGVGSDACTDSVYTALRTVPITEWSQNEYDYFIHFWQQCTSESKKRSGQPYDFCSDSLYLSIRLKQVEGMTDQELDYFIRCRRECIASLMKDGYEYSRALDRRYRISLEKSNGKVDKRRMIFMDNVERDDQKRNSQKAAAAGVTAAAVIIPTAVPVVLLGIIYFVALVANTRL